MKSIRAVLLAVFLTLSIFSAVTYTACNKNHCHNVLCLNYGSCDGGSCVCLPGYEGNRCQTLSRDKFIFTYNGHDSCGHFNGHTYDQYPIRLLAVPLDSTEMTLKGLLDSLSDSAICTMQSPDSFSFIGANNSTTYYGSGKLRNDSLWLNYLVKHDTTQFSCNYFGISLK